ncbi:unnamed protein product [Rotaria sordida]|uniref:Uncharacterized protein n=1 Tax=Rotaria sordida TaxID=392033 RepID=A0A819L772_9BILA|nr:unnamed protein product [Rotaria sordida]CAF3956587.1 unnamed protein product [Rotaria sordida]
MQSSISLSSISSSNSSIYGSQTILNIDDLPSTAPRCRSSIICSLDNNNNEILFLIRSKIKCCHLFYNYLSSTSYSLSSLFRKNFFTKLCHYHRLLLVLNDYQCKCGCQFSIKQGTFVILYETKIESLLSWNKIQFLTVISNQLICSKVPSYFLCDINVLSQRVRSRSYCNNEQSFDL